MVQRDLLVSILLIQVRTVCQPADCEIKACFLPGPKERVLCFFHNYSELSVFVVCPVVDAFPFKPRF